MSFNKYKPPVVQDHLSLEDLLDNFDSSHSHNLTKEQYTKLSQFIMEDSRGTHDVKSSISIKIAKQILKNVLRREIDSQ